MESILSYKRTVGIITLAAGLTAMLCNILLAMSVQFNFEAFANPNLVLDMIGIDAGLIKWGMVADMLGYYLLLLPAVYYLHVWMKAQTNWSFVATFCGSTYVLVGAIGAAALASAWPPIVDEYAQADATTQQILKSDFSLVTNIVFVGMLNVLEPVLGGCWWLMVGRMLYRHHKFLGSLTILLGIVTFLDGIGTLGGMQVLSAVSINIYLGLAPAWAVWLGLTLLLFKVKYA